MENDTPLPVTGNPIANEDNRRRNMPLIQSTPHFLNSGSAQNAVRVRGSGFQSTLSGSESDSQAFIDDLSYFPGGDTGLADYVSVELGEEEQQREGKGEERDEDQMNVEVQIGRRLREIGDRFQEENLQLFMRYRRNQQPFWWRVVLALYVFLFPREFIRH